MANKSFQPCAVCGKATRGRWCPEHEKQGRERNLHLNRQRHHDDPYMKLYDTKAWEAFRNRVLALNPLCQRLDQDGQQCRNAAVIVHHFVSPKQDLTRFTDQTNVAGVCRNCHPNTEGEPDASSTVLAKLYTPTVWKAWTV